MKILAISCSNVKYKKGTGTSYRTAVKALDICKPQEGDEKEIVELLDYSFTPCIFCGKCKDSGNCLYDEPFNEVYKKMKEAQRIIFTVPFYSVVPAKLTMLFEKLNQIYYSGWIKDPEAPFSLSGKKTAVIAHGGTDLKEQPQMAQAYRDMLLKPVNHCLSSLGMEVQGAKDDRAGGVVFGVRGYGESDESIFPDMLHDWEEIEKLMESYLEE